MVLLGGWGSAHSNPGPAPGWPRPCLARGTGGDWSDEPGHRADRRNPAAHGAGLLPCWVAFALYRWIAERRKSARVPRGGAGDGRADRAAGRADAPPPRRTGDPGDPQRRAGQGRCGCVRSAAPTSTCCGSHASGWKSPRCRPATCIPQAEIYRAEAALRQRRPGRQGNCLALTRRLARFRSVRSQCGSRPGRLRRGRGRPVRRHRPGSRRRPHPGLRRPAVRVPGLPDERARRAARLRARQPRP